jgi:hypothetical protein
MIAAGGVTAALLVAVVAGADPPASPAGAGAVENSAQSPPASGVEAKPAPTETTKEHGPPPDVESVAPTSAVGILGKQVRGPSGENMGLVVDVLVGSDGVPRAAVIDFGGFLGVGSRKIGVDWRLLHFKPDDRNAPILLDLDRTQVQGAPEYKEAATPLQILAPPPPPPAAGSTPSDDGK